MGTTQPLREVGLVVTWRACLLPEEDRGYLLPVGCGYRGYHRLQKWPQTFPVLDTIPFAMHLCNSLCQEMESISPALETIDHETCFSQRDISRCNTSRDMKNTQALVLALLMLLGTLWPPACGRALASLLHGPHGQTCECGCPRPSPPDRPYRSAKLA